MDWSKLPDILAIALLACAFASVSRQSKVRSSGLWLIGWLLIMLHFAAFFFLPMPGIWSTLATLVGLVSLAWAGIVFIWAALPYHQEPSSPWMLGALFLANTVGIVVLTVQAPPWLHTVAAFLFGLGPLAVALSRIHRFHHPLRSLTVVLNASLAAFLLIAQHRGAHDETCLNAILFTVYFSTALHFWYICRNNTAGAFITVAGFFAWSSVFVVSPLLGVWFPRIAFESEVWNLPKYVVAVGMILLLLENQIEYNKHLALHDELTGLPNRRLFHDRLTSALERARRTKTQAALLVVDLDHFKQVNDTQGHHIGDLLLRHVAQIFSSRIRRSDTVSRTGGDEFSIILEEPTSSTIAAQVGRSLLDMLKHPIELEGRTVRVGASVGFAIYPDDAADQEALCVVADLRMYSNKRGNESASDPGQPGNSDPPFQSLKSQQQTIRYRN